MKAMWKIALPALAVMVSSMGFAASGDSVASKATAAPSFRRDIVPVFQTNCVMCHQASVAMGGLDLLPDDAYAMLVKMPSTQSGMLRVAPGKPDRSYLVRKLEGTHAAGGKGVPMPLGQAPLSAEEMNMLKRWISRGAADN